MCVCVAMLLLHTNFLLWKKSTILMSQLKHFTLKTHSTYIPTSHTVFTEEIKSSSGVYQSYLKTQASLAFQGKPDPKSISQKVRVCMNKQ